MDKIYSKSFWNLFGELDSSLNPAAPEQLYDIAGPTFTPGSASSTSVAGTPVT